MKGYGPGFSLPLTAFVMEVMWVTGKASLMNHKQESCFTKLYIDLHKIALKHKQMEILKSSFSLEN